MTVAELIEDLKALPGYFSVTVSVTAGSKGNVIAVCTCEETERAIIVG